MQLRNVVSALWRQLKGIEEEQPLQLQILLSTINESNPNDQTDFKPQTYKKTTKKHSLSSNCRANRRKKNRFQLLHRVLVVTARVRAEQSGS
ncbi:hypothetical protein GBF38_006299, partial [Nibea albiflora]